MPSHTNQNPGHNAYQPLEHDGRTYEQFRSRYVPIFVPGPDGEWVPVRRDPAVTTTTTTSYQHPNHRAAPSLQRQNAQEGIFSDHYGPSFTRHQERRGVVPTYVPQRRGSVESYYEYVPARVVSPYEEIDIREGQHLRDTGEEAWVDLGNESRTGARQESGQGRGNTSSAYQNRVREVLEEPEYTTGVSGRQRDHRESQGLHIYLPSRDLRDADLVFPERHDSRQQEHFFHAARRPPARTENRDYSQGGDRHTLPQLPASQQVRPRLHHGFRPQRRIYELPRHHSNNEHIIPRERPSATSYKEPSRGRRARNAYSATVEDGEAEAEIIFETPAPHTADATHSTTTQPAALSPEEIAQIMEELRFRGILVSRTPSPSPPDSVKNASEVAQGPNSELANDADGRGVEASEQLILAHSPASSGQEYRDAYNDSGAGEVHANSPIAQEDPEQGEVYEDAHETPVPVDSQLDSFSSAPVQPRCPSCHCCYVMQHVNVRIRELEAEKRIRDSEREDHERETEDLIRWRYDQDVGDVDIEANDGEARTANDIAQDAAGSDGRSARRSPRHTDFHGETLSSTRKPGSHSHSPCPAASLFPTDHPSVAAPVICSPLGRQPHHHAPPDCPRADRRDMHARRRRKVAWSRVSTWGWGDGSECSAGTGAAGHGRETWGQEKEAGA